MTSPDDVPLLVSNGAVIAVLFAALMIILLTRSLLWRVTSMAARHGIGMATRGGMPPRKRAGLRSAMASRFPRAAGFAESRLSAATFSGLPTTVLVLVAGAVLLLLIALFDHVRHTAGVIDLDQRVNAFFGAYRVDWLVRVFLWITGVAVGPSLAAMLGTATALLWSSGRRVFVLPLWMTFLGAQATTWSSKYIIARPRPVFLPTVSEWNPSFPSGHATASTALVGFLGYAVARGLARRRDRFEVGFWSAIIVALICFSRLFLSLHFLTDVTAGVLVGLFWLIVGVTLCEWRLARHGGENVADSVRSGV